MSEPTQLAPFDAQDQSLHAELLLGVGTPRPVRLTLRTGLFLDELVSQEVGLPASLPNFLSTSVFPSLVGG